MQLLNGDELRLSINDSEVGAGTQFGPVAPKTMYLTMIQSKTCRYLCSTRAIRFAFWVSIVICVVIACVWATSLRWTILYISQFGDAIVLKGGTVSYDWTTMTYRLSSTAQNGLPLKLTWIWDCSLRRTAVQWAPVYDVRPYGRGVIVVPLWIPFLASFIVFIALKNIFARIRPGVCANCEYSLEGLRKPTHCPECGSLMPIYQSVRIAVKPLEI